MAMVSRYVWQQIHLGGKDRLTEKKTFAYRMRMQNVCPRCKNQLIDYWMKGMQNTSNAHNERCTGVVTRREMPRIQDTQNARYT